MASYPSNVKSFATRASGNTIEASHVNELQDEVVALEQGLLQNLQHDITGTSSSGVGFVASHASGVMRWATGGSTEKMRLDGSGFLRSTNGTTSAAHATATTIHAITQTAAGVYLVAACLAGAGAANYTAWAIVISDAANARAIADNGVNLTITVSGSNIQVTQSSGTTQTVTWSVLRVGG